MLYRVSTAANTGVQSLNKLVNFTDELFGLRTFRPCSSTCHNSVLAQRLVYGRPWLSILKFSPLPPFWGHTIGGTFKEIPKRMFLNGTMIQALECVSI